MLHLKLQKKGLKSILIELDAGRPRAPILQSFVENFDGELAHINFKRLKSLMI